MYNKNFALYVYHGSYAERYAKDSNINYCYIGEYQHNYKPEISKEPTCTEPGETTYTCIECGNSYKEPITAKGHTLKEVVKKATEKENGSITMQCTECQAIEGEPTIIYAVEKIELSETSFVRDGSVKMPSITIEDSQGNALQKMIDYTINYPYAIEPGTYTVDIRFSENYTGTVERTFTIMPDLTGDPQEDFTYRELEDGSLEITKYAGKETELVIPEKIDDKIVSKIAAHAFSDCKNLVSVIIPESVTSIEQRAFASCSLKSVTLPQGIKSLEKELFNYTPLYNFSIKKCHTGLSDV